MAPPLSVTLALASSVPMAVLGLLLIVPKPRRSEQVFFGLFAVGWAGLLTATNVGLALDSADAFRVASLVHFALLPPTYLFLAQFTATVHGGRRAWLIPAGFGVAAVLATAVLVLDPSLALASVAEEGGSLGAVVFGDAAFPLFFVPEFAAFYVCLGVLYLRYRRAPAGSPRYRYRGMLIALALFTSYQTVTNLWLFGVAPFSGAGVSGPLGRGLAGLLFLAGAVFLAGLVLHLLARPADPGQRDPALLAAFLVPAAVALATETLPWIPVEARTWGLWRLLMVAVLVHAVARYRLFDLDLKVKRWAAPGVALALVTVAGLAAGVRWLEGEPLASTAPTLVIGVAAAGSLYTARDHVARTLFPSAVEAEAYRERRKYEVYRAALEPVVEDAGDVEELAEEPVLAGLRRDLGVSREEHDAMVFQLADRKDAAPADTLGPVEPGAVVGDRYVVDRLIGEGAHGRTFAALDRETERTVALKVVGKPAIGAARADALLREVRLLREIDHPNVVEVLDVLDGRHEVALVTAYAAGGSLGDLLERRGGLGRTRATAALVGTLRALAAAHERAIVHRDVKPSNLLLSEEGEVRLADFGIARRSGDGDTALDVGPVGTLLYMAPEQVRGEPVTERTDLYAAAVVFHLALTGSFYLPVAGLDDFGIRRAIVEEPPRLPGDEQPAWVRELLERALAKDPEERFPSARAMLDAIPDGMKGGPPPGG